MRAQLLFRKAHKWLGLILGIQILLWFFSGFMMSWMPIEEIHGDHLLKTVSPNQLSLQNIDLNTIVNQVNEPIFALKIKPWLGETVVEVTTASAVMLFETTHFRLISPINEVQIRQVLAAHLLAEFQVLAVNLLTTVPDEARGRKAPLWQVQLSGDESPQIYISAENGEIVAKRTDRWRLFDFLWMLHIMDYDEREDFNHPLLYLTALSALIFTLTGFVLLYYRLRKKPTTKSISPLKK